jgi:threonine dehydratase
MPPKRKRSGEDTAEAPAVPVPASPVPVVPAPKNVDPTADDSDDAAAEVVDRRRGETPLQWIARDADPATLVADDNLPVTAENVLAASKRVERHVIKTSCELSPKLSKLFGAEVYIKREYWQSSGSFKERGAVNAMLKLSPAERKAGVIAASAGNHALGLATHGKRLGIPVRVVMPTIAPQTKIQNCAALGAEVILHGDDFDQATQLARKLGEENGWTYVHGFDNAHVIAGQGSIGVEVMEQVPDLDAIIVPVGGAGLIAGIALAVKEISPRTLVLGVEPLHYACTIRALQAGEPVTLQSERMTIADGLAVRRVGAKCLPICRSKVDRIVTVTDHAIALSMLRFVELEKTIAEGAGATCIAPFIDGQFLDGETPGAIDLRGKKVVVVCCGGNVDVTMLGRIIDHGLTADGRLVRIWCMISDRPGALAEFTRGCVADLYFFGLVWFGLGWVGLVFEHFLTARPSFSNSFFDFFFWYAVLASTGASTKHVEHNRPRSGDNFNTVQLKVEFETKSGEHMDLVIRTLREAKYDVHLKDNK